MFGRGQQGDALKKLPLLCKDLNAKGKWKNHWSIEVMDWTAQSRFLSALSNPHPPVGGRIFCSPEQSKLCF